MHAPPSLNAPSQIMPTPSAYLKLCPFCMPHLSSCAAHAPPQNHIVPSCDAPPPFCLIHLNSVLPCPCPTSVYALSTCPSQIMPSLHGGMPDYTLCPCPISDYVLSPCPTQTIPSPHALSSCPTSNYALSPRPTSNYALSPCPT